MLPRLLLPTCPARSPDGSPRPVGRPCKSAAGARLVASTAFIRHLVSISAVLITVRSTGRRTSLMSTRARLGNQKVGQPSAKGATEEAPCHRIATHYAHAPTSRRREQGIAVRGAGACFCAHSIEHCTRQMPLRTHHRSPARAQIRNWEVKRHPLVPSRGRELQRRGEWFLFTVSVYTLHVWRAATK